MDRATERIDGDDQCFWFVASPGVSARLLLRQPVDPKRHQRR
jgi:hypothetical protein